MAHVTLIHGIANKPPAHELLRILRNAMATAREPLPLGDLGVSSTLVYWADLLYEQPETDLSAYEGVLENSPEAIDGGGDAPVVIPTSTDEAAFLERLRLKMTALSDVALEVEDTPAVPAEPQGALERVPLPWFIKKRFLSAFLRDVHHYLFDVAYAPGGGTPLPIQQTIRKRFLDALNQPHVSRPHIVISHSMGTVIAYDCLKRVPECPPIDGLITLGSPLGLDEVQDKLQPGWSRPNGFPQEKVSGPWANFFDRLDPVCGFDPKLANDFCREGSAAIQDVAVQNDGAWRHSITKYLRQPDYCRTLRRMLQL